MRWNSRHVTESSVENTEYLMFVAEGCQEMLMEREIPLVNRVVLIAFGRERVVLGETERETDMHCLLYDLYIYRVI